MERQAQGPDLQEFPALVLEPVLETLEKATGGCRQAQLSRCPPPRARVSLVLSGPHKPRR